MKLSRTVSLLALTCLLSAPAYAQHHEHGDHAHHAAPVTAKLGKAAAAQEKVHAAMHKAMMVKYVGDPDTDFVRGMIPHHQGAVDMAKVVLKYGKDEEIKELARRIIAAQETEIGMMKRWIYINGFSGKVDRKGGAETIAAFGRIMNDMHRDMNIRYSNNADVDFVRGMIPHHQGAIDMAGVLLEHGRDPELRALAYDIIGSQSQEIEKMKCWLKSREKARGK